MVESSRVSNVVPSEVWQAIEQRCTEITFCDGEVLMHHGGGGRTCYAIASGTVLVTATSSQGALVVLGRRGPGSLVGELAALEGSPRAATVTARGEVAARVLRRDDLFKLLDEYPSWAISMLQDLAGQLRSMAERYTLRSEDLRRRVAEVLVVHLDETGEPAFRSTREELAGWVGATREATVRMLQQLKEEGLVDLGRGVVTVIDRERLIG